MRKTVVDAFTEDVSRIDAEITERVAPPEFRISLSRSLQLVNVRNRAHPRRLVLARVIPSKLFDELAIQSQIFQAVRYRFRLRLTESVR
jgi:hypothetical protein